MQMTRTFAVALAVATTCLAAATAPALGATPFTAGTGDGFDMAVGYDGTAHVVWRTSEADDRIGYCRVPAGGSACDSESTFLNYPDGASATASGQGDLQVFVPETGMIVIYAACTQCPSGDTSTNVYRLISSDNGVTFPVTALVGDISMSGQGDYIGGGNALAVSGGQFQAFAAGGGPITLGGSPSYVYSASAVRVPAMNEAVYVVNNLSAVRYRVWNNLSQTPTQFNTLANWAPASTLSSPEPDNQETHLSSGGSGLFLSYRSAVAGDSRIGLRRYDPVTNGFGAPLYLESGAPVDDNDPNMPHHEQDYSGRLHAVWRTLHDGGRLRYTRSDDGGASFTAPGNLAAGESFLDPMVDAGTAGTGFAAWHTTGSVVRVVAIDPQPEPPTGGPGGPGGSDTTAPAAGGFRVGDTSLAPGEGTSFVFNSSEAGRAVLTVQKQVKGLKAKVKGKRRCVPRTPKRLRKLRRAAGTPAKFRALLRKRFCKAWKKKGSIRKDVRAGTNTIVWNGRLAGRRLGPGRYRALLVITDAAGNVSRTERVNFRVIRRRRAG